MVFKSMKRKILLFLLLLVAVLPTMASDDVFMLTRNGDLLEIKLDRITTNKVYFINLQKRKRGTQIAPRDFVYMIKTEKKTTIFFKENGDEVTRNSVEVDDDDDVIYLMEGKELVVYNINVQGDVVTFKLGKRKKDKLYHLKKEEIFMIRHKDGYKEIFAKPYVVKQPPVANNTPSVAPSVSATPQSTTPATSQPINEQDIYNKVYAANPYTLFKKGATATYAFMRDGKETKIPFYGYSYAVTTVSDVKIENGNYVVYYKQDYLNAKQERSKTTSMLNSKLFNMIYPTVIDTMGNFHWTHDILRDNYSVTKRKGYAAIISVGLSSTSGFSTAKIVSDDKITCDYTGLSVIGEEDVNTSCGTFRCLKISGNVVISNSNSKRTSNETIWFARGIGVVKHVYDDGTGKPITMFLAKLINN